MDNNIFEIVRLIIIVGDKNNRDEEYRKDTTRSRISTNSKVSFILLFFFL